MGRLNHVGIDGWVPTIGSGCEVMYIGGHWVYLSRIASFHLSLGSCAFLNNKPIEVRDGTDMMLLVVHAGI